MLRRLSVIGFFIMMTVPPVHALEIRIDLSDGSGTPAGNWNIIAQVNMTDTDLVPTTAGDRTVDRGLV